MDLEKLIQARINLTFHQKIKDFAAESLRERENILRDEKKKDEEAGFERIARDKKNTVRRIDDAIEILEDGTGRLQTALETELDKRDFKRVEGLINNAVTIAIENYLKRSPK